MKLVKKIRTLIVDDSITIRKIIRHLLSSDDRFEVIDEASFPQQALDIINSQNLDLITMDLHLPKMNGSELIKRYVRSRPIPTVVISSLRPEDSHLVLESLENGAVDYIQKPDQQTLLAMKIEILERLFQASKTKVAAMPTTTPQQALSFEGDKGLLVIGASTGGTEAIKVLLGQMGDQIPPTLVVQHIPPFFSEAFAARLNRCFSFEVKEAKNGDIVKSNQVLIAPGGRQMKIVKKGADHVVLIDDSAPVNRHRPSVDVLFDSVCIEYEGTKVAVLLTGMGADGAEGLLHLKTKGAYTLAQDENTCVVFGMPREAIKRGAATEVCGLHEMGAAIHRGFQYCSRGPKKLAYKT